MIGHFRRSREKKAAEARRRSFNNIMEVIRLVAAENPAALPDLIIALGRSTQWMHINYILTRDLHDNDHEPEAKHLFFSEHAPLNQEGETLYDLCEKLPSQRVFRLSHDLVLPWPWERGRLVGCLSHIGAPEEPWVQDDNHRIEAWEPLGIGWVFSGNHSIAAGVIRGEGVVSAEITYDISAVYKYVRCDGAYYLRTDDGSILGAVSNEHFAAICETGRLILQARQTLPYVV